MKGVFRGVLVLILLLAVWRPAEAAVALVGFTPGQTTSASDTLVITRSVAAGNLLVACAGVFNSNGTTITISDNVNAGNYSQGLSKAPTGSPNDQIHCYYKANVGAGSTSVTFNPAGSSAVLAAVVMEISGAPTSSPLDAAATATAEAAVNAGASYTATVTTGALAQSANLVVGIASHTCLTHALGAGATFTQVAENENNSALQAYHTQYKIVASTSAVAVSWAQANNPGTSCNWMAGALVFKEATSNDSTPPSDPSSLNATAITSGRIDLSWTGSTDSGGSGLAHYNVRRSTGAGSTPTTIIATPAAGTTTYIDQNLAAGTIYRYTVQAQDGAGNVSSQTSASQATTLATESRTVTWTPVPPLTQDGFSIWGCVTPSASCTPDAVIATTGPAATAQAITAGRPVQCVAVQANLTGTSGSALSSPPACTTAIANQFTLTIAHASDDTGTGTTVPPVGTSVHADGATVALSATADANSDFVEWSGTGCPSSPASSGNVTMSTDRTCTAKFNLQAGDFAFVAHRGSGTSATSSTTLTFAPAATIAAGQLAVAACASDNTAAASGQTNEHTFTDSASNVWVKIREHANAGGATAGGVTASLWASKLTTQLTTGSTMTLTLSAARVAKVCQLKQFNLESGQTFELTAASAGTGTGTTPSAVLSSLESGEYLLIGLVGAEGPSTDTFTQDTDYKASTPSVGTSGGTATANVTSRFGFRRATLTGDTYNPTLGTSRDWVDVLVALKAITQPSTFTITATKSGDGDGTVLINGVSTLGPVTFNSGTVVQIQAVPDGSSAFVTWSNVSGNSCEGSASGADPVQSVTLTENTVCDVEFDDVPTTPGPWDLVIEANAGNGTGTTTPAIGSTTQHADGTVVNLVATPGAGSFFAGWTGTGCTTGSVIMTQNRNCTPTFTLLPTFTLTLATAGTGQGSVSGGGTFAQGAIATITATPALGSTFAGWSGAGCPTTAVSPESVLMNANKTCTATFNVPTQEPPTGTLTIQVVPRCVVQIEARVTSGIGIAEVMWKIDGATVATCGQVGAACVSTVPAGGVTQKPPAEIVPGLFRYSLRKTLVFEGSEITAEFEDLAGQTGTLGPIVTTCQ